MLLSVAIISHIFSVKKRSSISDSDAGIATADPTAAVNAIICVGLLVVDHFISLMTL